MILTNRNSCWIAAAIALAWFTFVAWALLQGATGPFLFDDFHNLETLGAGGSVNNWYDAQSFIFGNHSGPLGRPVAMITFLADDFTWPADPYAFKRTNILLHLATGLALFITAFRLLQRELRFSHSKALWLALALTAYWLVLPLHVSTVLYVIQRMAILSTFFSLLTFYFYLTARAAFRNRSSGKLVVSFLAAVVSLLFGIFSKENGIVVLLMIAVTELFILESVLSPSQLKFMRRLFGAAVGMVLVWLLFNFDVWGSAYSSRDFALTERLLLQYPILGDYLVKTVLPIGQYMNLYNSGLTDLENLSIFRLCSGIIAFTVLLIVFAYSISKRNNVLLLGVSWFLVFHVLESTILPLELYFEHRNYLPSMGIAAIVLYTITTAFRQADTKLAPLLGTGAYLVYLIFVLMILVTTWGAPAALHAKFYGDEPQSIRSKMSYALYMESLQLPEYAYPLVEEALALSPTSLALQAARERLVCLEPTLGMRKGFHSTSVNIEKSVVQQMAIVLKFYEVTGDLCEIDGTPLFEAIVSAAEQTEAFRQDASLRASIWALETDYHIDRRNFYGAVHALEKSVEISEKPEGYLKLAALQFSGGNPGPALSAIIMAEAADQSRDAFVPSISKQINALRLKIEQLPESEE